jgi:hypothetical protein
MSAAFHGLTVQKASARFPSRGVPALDGGLSGPPDHAKQQTKQTMQLIACVTLRTYVKSETGLMSRKSLSRKKLLNRRRGGAQNRQFLQSGLWMNREVQPTSRPT